MSVACIDWDNVPLGKYPDKTIADVLGVTSYVVARERNSREIPRFIQPLTVARTQTGIPWGIIRLGQVGDGAGSCP